MKRLELRTATRTFAFAIIMLLTGTLLSPQAQASKFRGIFGSHFGLGPSEYTSAHFGGGASASFGVQLAQLFYLGVGVNYDSYGDNYSDLAFFANPRLDLFNVSRIWTPFASGRIGYQILDEGNVYYGIDFGVRRALGGSKGLSLSIGLENVGYDDHYYNYQTFYKFWEITLAPVIRISFEF